MMEELHLGQRIASLRRERGLTQGALAAHLGVSKPAVSKWETGQSYPDIALLPLLASYFGVSVDALLDYRPQLTPQEVQAHYRGFVQAFTQEPFDAVYARVQALCKRYYACARLQFMMGALLLNHLAQAGARAMEVTRALIPVFERVEREGEDASLQRQALYMRAVCHLTLSEPDAAIALLEGAEEGPPSSLPRLLARAYQMKGDTEKALEAGQSELYTYVVSLIGCAPTLLSLYAGDAARIEDCYTRILQTAEVFDFPQMHPLSLAPVHLAASQCLLEAGWPERALDILEAYADLVCAPGVFPAQLRGSGFFDRLTPMFEGLDLGRDAPRSTAFIQRDCCLCVRDGPAYAPLAQHPRFRVLCARLERLLEDTQPDRRKPPC